MENKNLLLIDKPQGITSYDVIRALKKKLNTTKIGHSGTLDPRATGLLLVGFDEGTKLMKNLIGLPKVYQAEILLGTRTNTGDLDGEVIEEKDASFITEQSVKDELSKMLGDLVLEVSLYSAMKRRGKPLYKYARAGEKITPPKRVMTVISADFKHLGVEPSSNLELGVPNKILVEVEFEVGSGTYIRSLAEELGRRLGTVATLKNLRRISIGDFSIDDAEKLEDI